jgi:V/A-type H+/Na+-transporting ATPase subunit I
MFTSLSMRHVTLAVAKGDGPLAAYLLARHGACCDGAEGRCELHGATGEGQRYRELYGQARQRMERLTRHCQMPRLTSLGAEEPPDLERLAEVNAWLGELFAVASACEESRHRFVDELAHNDRLLREIHALQGLNLDLGMVQRQTRFLATRLGSLPAEALAQVQGELERVGIFERFGEQAGRVLGVLVCPRIFEEAALQLLAAYDWQELPLPPEFSAAPPQVEVALQQAGEALEQAVQTFVAKHQATCEQMRARLTEAQRQLALAEPFATLCNEVLLDPQGRLVLRGWLPTRQVRHLSALLTERLHAPFALELRKPRPDEHRQVPSIFRYPGWLEPFADLVRGYGTPCYGDLDPILLFAASFALMFGMMFGDVGHGLMIAGAGLALRGRLRRFRPLLLATGGASLLFGLAYGSLFGFHGILTPLWVDPIHNPLLMLEVALWWGFGFILVTQFITIYNRLAGRRSRRRPVGCRRPGRRPALRRRHGGPLLARHCGGDFGGPAPASPWWAFWPSSPGAGGASGAPWPNACSPP